MGGSHLIVVSMSVFATAGEVEDAARAALPREIWEYVSGGSGTEATLRANRAALDALRFVPRVGRDVSAVSAATTVLGMELAAPVLLAPIGTIGLFDAGGAATCARAAARAGSAAFVSILAVPALEEVAGAADAPLIFQHYTRGTREWSLELFRRAEAAGYRALCITLDSPVDGIRERELRNRFDRGAAQDRPNLGGSDRRELQAALSWSELAWLAGQTALPLILKGITHPDDAALAVEAGASAIVVSNHGGRQLDHLPGTIDVLPAVVEAVGDRVEVLVDGGFVRGADVVKALALGARAVLIGKAACFALAAGGEDALAGTLERLRVEVERNLALLGVTAPEALTPAYVRG
jgi:isopentenyl diphosphate isomerase/L-lactate dehydrogenase-like FMN-dependent dehydrogenase